MELHGLEIFPTANLTPGRGGQYFIFVKLTTICGIVGYGEVYATALHPDTMTTVIKDVFQRHVYGENPFNVEMMYRRVYSSGFTQRPDPTIMGAFSGLEIACWDIIGKSLDKPIWQLLGGKVRNKLRSYSYLYPALKQNAREFYSSPNLSTDAAIEASKLGFTAVKFDPAGPYTIYDGHQPSMANMALSEKFCKSIRSALGDKIDILFGTHGQFTAAGAIRLASKIAQYSPLWFEEPVPPDNYEAMRRVVENAKIPIATGERLTTKYEFYNVLNIAAPAIVQPALGRVGGIWETKKIASIAEVFGAQVAPHLYAGPIEWAANIQLSLTLPNFLILETIGIGDGFQSELIESDILWENGYIVPPSDPGLGIVLNESLALKHSYTGDTLHLNMQDTEFTPE